MAGLKFTVLGSGTSSGVPTISCKCPTCLSDNPKDKRLRTSLLIESGNTRVLIDTSPDFRQQMLKYNVKTLDAVLFTHAHFDHIGGFDDIRAFNYTSRKPVPIYVNEPTLAKLKRTFFYAFEKPEQLGGGVPVIDVNLIDGGPIKIGGLEIIPIPLMHGNLDVLGFRIGGLAYCTDTNYIPGSSRKALEGLDVLIIDALRYAKHPTHFCLEEAIAEAQRINPGQTYFTHMAHEIMHAECDAALPENMSLAYDGLVIEF